MGNAETSQNTPQQAVQIPSPAPAGDHAVPGTSDGEVIGGETTDDGAPANAAAQPAVGDPRSETPQADPPPVQPSDVESPQPYVAPPQPAMPQQQPVPQTAPVAYAPPSEPAMPQQQPVPYTVPEPPPAQAPSAGDHSAASVSPAAAYQPVSPAAGSVSTAAAAAPGAATATAQVPAYPSTGPQYTSAQQPLLAATRPAVAGLKTVPDLRLRRLMGVSAWALFLGSAGLVLGAIALFRMMGEMPGWFEPVFSATGVFGLALVIGAFITVRYRLVPWMLLGASSITFVVGIVLLGTA